MIRRLVRVTHRVLLALLALAAATLAVAWVLSYGSSPLQLARRSSGSGPPARLLLHIATSRGRLSLQCSRLVRDPPPEVGQRFKGWRVREVTRSDSALKSVTLSRGRPNRRSFGLFTVEYQKNWEILEVRLSGADLLRMHEFVFQSTRAPEPGLVYADFLAQQARFVFPIWVPFLILAAYPGAVLSRFAFLRGRRRPTRAG